MQVSPPMVKWQDDIEGSCDADSRLDGFFFGVGVGDGVGWIKVENHKGEQRRERVWSGVGLLGWFGQVLQRKEATSAVHESNKKEVDWVRAAAYLWRGVLGRVVPGVGYPALLGGVSRGVVDSA